MFVAVLSGNADGLPDNECVNGLFQRNLQLADEMILLVLEWNNNFSIVYRSQNGRTRLLINEYFLRAEIVGWRIEAIDKIPWEKDRDRQASLYPYLDQ